MKPPRKVRDLKPAPYNPRQLTDEQRAQLAESMRKFGDLSGVVFNVRSGKLIGGHQRKVHLPPEAAINVTTRLKKPNAQGTIAVGYINAWGEDWKYREVDVDPVTEALMNVAANRYGEGLWNVGKLSDVATGLQGSPLAPLTGFTPEELGFHAADWSVAPSTASADDYDPDAETVTVKVEEVPRDRVAVVMEAVSKGLKATGFDYRATCPKLGLQ